MTKHPAKFSDALLPVMYDHIEYEDVSFILDPFAGTGKLTKFFELGYEGIIYLNEIEPEWYMLCVEHLATYQEQLRTILGDARTLPLEVNSIDAVVTSPTYGNRMADSFTPGEGWDAAKSTRNTYTHAIGHKLNKANSGAMQWGKAYKSLHQQAWTEAQRVLRHNGVLVLNIKDHIRNGQRVYVSQWHVDTLLNLGFALTDVMRVETKGQRFGQNAEARLNFEYVLVFRNNPNTSTITHLGN